MYQSIAAIGLSPAITNSPVISGIHFTRAANAHESDDKSRAVPSATETPITLLRPPTVKTVAAMIFPSGDHDGPVKKIGMNRSGFFLTMRSRVPLPSVLAMTSALSAGFG